MRATPLSSGVTHVASGGESFANKPSLKYVQIVVSLSSTSATVPAGHLKVYAMGRRRTIRAPATRAGLTTKLHPAISRRMPVAAVSALSRFRAQHGMSKEALTELQELWDGAPRSDDKERATHVHFFMSLRTRRELTAFLTALRMAPPQHAEAARRALVSASLEHLLDPAPEGES